MITAQIYAMKGFNNPENFIGYAEKIGISVAEYAGRVGVLQQYLQQGLPFSEERFRRHIQSGEYMRTGVTTTQKMPSVRAILKNLWRDLKNILRSRKTSAEVYRKRMDVCYACKHLKSGRCMACGCVVRAKSLFSLLRCPMGYWSE